MTDASFDVDPDLEADLEGQAERPMPTVLAQALQAAGDHLQARGGKEWAVERCRQLGELHRNGLPAQVGQIARELLATGHPECARDLWRALQTAFPKSPAGWVGQANLAAKERRWDDAVKNWTAALERFPDRNQSVWKLGRARALHRLGLSGEAEDVLRQALTVDAEDPGVRQLLIHVLDRNGRLREALDLLKERPDVCAAEPGLQFVHLKLLTRLGHLDEAIQTSHALLGATHSVDALPGIVRLMPEMATGSDLIGLIRHTTERLDALEPSAAPARQRQVATELRLRLLLLSRRHQEFLSMLGELGGQELPARMVPAYRRMAQRLRTPLSELMQAPKVFGIGLSKTATTSLTRATEVLGMASAHYQNPLTFEFLDEEQAMYFDACADTPVSDVFERLYHLYPASKFVLTVRPLADWAESLSRHHSIHFGTADWSALRTTTGSSLACSAQMEWSLYFRHENAEQAWAAHTQRVQAFFTDKPASRFMTLDVFSGDGWPQLCSFLGCSQPASPFPHENALRDGG